jgi:hypothetical protein
VRRCHRCGRGGPPAGRASTASDGDGPSIWYKFRHGMARPRGTQWLWAGAGQLHEAAHSGPRGSPKTGHRGSLQNRPTITTIQDVDFDTRAATLGRCEQCLERGTETANYRIGTAGLVAAEDSEDHRRPTRDRR